MKLAKKPLTHLLLLGAMVASITMHVGSTSAQQTTAPAGQNDITAIDILLDPDATMIQHATAANAQLLKNYPKGYTLGGAHAPHITVLQRHVKTADLPKVYAAADKVFASENPTTWKLTAVKYYYIPDQSIGLGGIVVKPTPDLLRLQQELIDAVTPFTVPAGTAAAYVTTPEDPDILPAVIQYVEVFVPEHSGDHYSPHVTTGIGTTDFLNALVAAPFDNFTFSPAGASIYHLGNYGTAMTKLHSIPLKH
jgi:hypothetical protein